MKIKSIVFASFVAFTGFAFLQKENSKDLFEAGAKLEKLAGDFSFTEGPSADLKGNVYFTDQPNDRIMVWSIDDVLSTFMQPSGRSNGLSFDKHGDLWSCADERTELWRISDDKKVEVIVGKYEGKLFNGPNDLWISKSGGIYFTDPFYKRAWWDHSAMPQEIQGVYFLSPDHKNVVCVADDLKKPNGIVGTPDGKKLYVADIGASKTWSFKINKDGSLSDKKLFCEMGSDGMAMDINENIYITGKGVTIFDSTGKQIGVIEVPENWTANVCFGGKDMKSLFITASKGLYRMRMNIKGTRD